MERKHDVEKAVKNLSQALQIPTVSNVNYDTVNWNEFDRFLKFLEKTYENVYNNCSIEYINEYSPLIILKGKNETLKPMLLLAHYDVVPVEEESEKLWEVGAFSGAVKDDFIWGRGALDIKNQLIAIMEAVDYLISENITPERDVYITFGFDEEVGGARGAKVASEIFEERGIEFEVVLDEGGCIIKDMLDGLTQAVAVIGIAEKGSTHLKITVDGKSGHSSTPPKDTAIVKLSRIISNIENNPMPAKLTLPVKVLFETLAPYMGKKKLILKNIDKLFPMVNATLAKSPTLNSLIRTTIAFSTTAGGKALNSLPENAWATANLRMLPENTVEETIAHMRNLNKGLDFKVDMIVDEEASEISNIETESYRKLSKLIEEEFKDVIAVPYLVTGGTDSRKYYNVSKNIYRFTPMMLTSEGMGSIHSVNEKISIDNLKNMIDFYIRFIKEI